MNIEQLLAALGIEKNDATVYRALLEMGTGTVADIARQTNLHRPSIYASLQRLGKQNFVAFSPQGKRRVYYAESPQRLKQLITQLDDELDQVLPDLLATYAHHEQKPKMRFFEGKKVAAFVYEDLLATCKKGEVFYRYESPRNYKKNDEWLPPQYFERICRKKEIEKFVITNEKTFRSKPQVMERVSRMIPAEFDPFEYNITQVIYANSVAFIDFDSQTAWIIENQRFATFQRQIFKLLFKQL